MEEINETDIFMELDSLVTDVSEWEMWDILRTIYGPTHDYSIPGDIQLKVYFKYTNKTKPLIFRSFSLHP